ncbi:MAG: hypothetical protein QNJ00_15285 [Woeseiaceae bacterium]|nr:hypothetical protein [Woeseiaceae bacterium]
MKLRRKFILAGIVLLAGLFLWFREPPEVELPAPLVERLAAIGDRGLDYRTVADIINFGRVRTPMYTVNVPQDALPNSLAIAMAPFFVDWESKEGDDDSLLVRNVNIAGNPVAGTALLATVRVPIDGVTGVEWCVTPDANSGRIGSMMAHAQLRFVFAQDRLPEVLDLDGETYALMPTFDDLVLSWEAWRPPRTRWNAVEGIKPDVYALTSRAYSGEFRWLGDALRGNPWQCYPLALPETEDATRSVLLTALLVGDALARRMIESMTLDDNLALPEEALAEWEALSDEERAKVRAVLSSEGLPNDPVADLMGQASLSYQLLERSCITQSLGVVQLALLRIYHDNDLGEAPEMRIVPEDLPSWVEDLATAGTGKMIGYVPGALLYVARNQQIIPTEAYRILQDAGLLKIENGAPVYYYYQHKGNTPYGEFRENMM